MGELCPGGKFLIYLKHFVVWLYPINVVLNTHAKQPAFQIKHLQNIHQTFPSEVDTQKQWW